MKGNPFVPSGIVFRVASGDGHAFGDDGSSPDGTLHAVSSCFIDTTACGAPVRALHQWEVPWSDAPEEARCLLCTVIADSYQVPAEVGGQSTPPHADPLNANIDLAAAMVAAQVRCDRGDGMNRLRARAERTGQTLHDLAVDVLDGLIRFDG